MSVISEAEATQIAKDHDEGKHAHLRGPLDEPGGHPGCPKCTAARCAASQAAMQMTEEQISAEVARVVALTGMTIPVEHKPGTGAWKISDEMLLTTALPVPKERIDYFKQRIGHTVGRAAESLYEDQKGAKRREDYKSRLEPVERDRTKDEQESIDRLIALRKKLWAVGFKDPVELAAAYLVVSRGL